MKGVETIKVEAELRGSELMGAKVVGFADAGLLEQVELRLRDGSFVFIEPGIGEFKCSVLALKPEMSGGGKGEEG